MCFVIKNWIFKEDQICFYVKERIRFLLKSTDVFCEKLKKKKKKKKGDFIKKNQIYFL